MVNGGQPVELSCNVLGKRHKSVNLHFNGQAADKGSRQRIELGQPAIINSEIDYALNEALESSSTNEHLNDLISLIFWYKDNDPVPLYTLDARQVLLPEDKIIYNQDKSIMRRNQYLLSRARHYSASARFKLEADNMRDFPIIKLRLERAEAADSGQYKCRVDYKRSSTINELVSLLVEGNYILEETTTLRAETHSKRAKN